jgi:hypothetical protein
MNSYKTCVENEGVAGAVSVQRNTYTILERADTKKRYYICYSNKLYLGS